MSLYYFMVCDKHLERTDAASHSAGGIGPLADSNHTLLKFIVTHADCPVRIVNENEDDAYSKAFTDWTEQNAEEMRFKQRRDIPMTDLPKP